MREIKTKKEITTLIAEWNKTRRAEQLIDIMWKICKDAWIEMHFTDVDITAKDNIIYIKGKQWLSSES